jgi:hypothetical protein
MKIDKPHKIAICLNAPTLERANQQKEALNGIQDLFEIEWDLRSERFTGDYISFSQMINEAVLCTESEFMIFINPKAKVQKEDIIKIIDSLCNGYCLSNIMAFGLWGTTKQLFREIGMFDERLIGFGEEDGDITYRMISKKGKDVYRLYVQGVYNIVSDIRHEHIKSGVGKYSWFNRDFTFNKKYNCQNAISGISGMFGMVCDQILTDEKLYPYEKFFKENKEKL